jgi:hypothetical protein
METVLRKPASRYRVLRLRRRLQVWAMTRSFKAAAALARDIGGQRGDDRAGCKAFAITQALAKPTPKRRAAAVQPVHRRMLHIYGARSLAVIPPVIHLALPFSGKLLFKPLFIPAKNCWDSGAASMAQLLRYGKSLA